MNKTHRLLIAQHLPLWVLLLWLLAAPSHGAQAPIIPPPPSITASSHLLMDYDTGELLVEHNADEALPPASLTKIMTVFVTSEEMRAGRISADDIVTVSTNAWRTPGSRMFIEERSKVRVDDLVKGVVIQSGNDASVALAEHIAGSEGAFADMMNQQAIALGMTLTQFQNATGLPAENHYTTARDLSLLTRAMIEQHPEVYDYYAVRSFTHNDIEQPNRNRLLWRDRTVDGVKTGHTEEAGYCLVASAEREGMRLISVVMGTGSDEARMRESQKLLSFGFRYFETQSMYEAGVPLKTADLWYAEADTLDLGVSEQVIVTIPRGSYNDIEAELKVRKIIEAPVAQGDELGELVLRLHGEVVHRAPLMALEDIPEAGIFTRGIDFVVLFFKQLISGD
ncbi:MAG: D-alanyl-D-alanine carboxypeptidase family protein [Pseudomonadales bacterium]